MFTLGIVPCRTTANTEARPDAKAIAPEAAESKVGTESCRPTTGLARFFGAVEMGLGSENPGFLKLESLFDKGALKGKAGMVVETALANNLDPKLFAAIIAHETGRGTSSAIRNYNNPAGIMDPASKWTKLKRFETLSDGLDYSAKNLRRRMDQVGGDLEKLAKVYAPIGAENDPNNLNANWLTGVSKFYNLLEAKETPVASPASDSTLLAR